MSATDPPCRCAGEGVAPACLDGVHLIRYGQFGGTGGISAHLETLDAALVSRFAMTIHELAADPGCMGGSRLSRVREGRGERARVDLAEPARHGGDGEARRSDARASRVTATAARLLVRALGPVGPTIPDRLRSIHGGLAALPWLPELLPCTRRLPRLGSEGQRLCALQQRAGKELDRIVAEAGGAPLVFVSHLPERADSLLVTREAFRRHIPAALVHHTGATPRAALLLARGRALVRAAGAVSLRGLGGLLGDGAVELGNGVDTDFFDRDRAGERGRFRARHRELRPGALLVLVAGKVCGRKRQLDVLRACASLRAERGLPDFQLVLAGAAPDRRYSDLLADEVRRSGLAGSVVMTGHLGREELREAYRDADLGVLASELEGRPRVLLEMGAMGVPVVATDAGGSRDTLLPGRTGLLVPVGDRRRLAAAIGELLADAPRRLRFGEAGAAFVREHHRLDLLVERHVRFYLGLLGGRGGPALPAGQNPAVARAAPPAQTDVHPPARRPTLVYITGMSHCGSTLLDLLISGHSDVVSVGEIKQLGRTSRRIRCNCGAEPPACPFWSEVDRRLRDAGAPALAALDVNAPDPVRFAADNLALLRAVGEISGCRIIVDSSKNPRRLRHLQRVEGVDVRVIHLLRHPCGVAWSHARKGRRLVATAVEQAKRTLRIRWLLRRTPHLEVRYEKLAASPAATLGDVMAWLGVAAEPEQLDFAGRERHNIGGNRMRFAADATIALDEKWKAGLSWLQKALIAAVSVPARIPGAALAFALWVRLRSGGDNR